MGNLHKALIGSPAASGMQPSQPPAAPPAGGPAAGPQDGLSLFKALHPNIDPGMAETIYKVAVQQGGTPTPAPKASPDPYQNAAQAITEDKNVR